MYARALSAELIKSLEKYPAVVISGSRQSRKPTLVKSLFPQFTYLSLEDPDLRGVAVADSRPLRGLPCYLLRITNTDKLFSNPLRGAIFENGVIVETIKTFLNQGKEAPVYFWRDTRGHEVDLVIDRGNFLEPVEIKSARDLRSQLRRRLHLFSRIADPKRRQVGVRRKTQPHV